MWPHFSQSDDKNICMGCIICHNYYKPKFTKQHGTRIILTFDLDMEFLRIWLSWLTCCLGLYGPLTFDLDMEFLRIWLSWLTCCLGLYGPLTFDLDMEFLRIWLSWLTCCLGLYGILTFDLDMEFLCIWLSWLTCCPTAIVTSIKNSGWWYAEWKKKTELWQGSLCQNVLLLM